MTGALLFLIFSNALFAQIQGPRIQSKGIEGPKISPAQVKPLSQQKEPDPFAADPRAFGLGQLPTDDPTNPDALAAPLPRLPASPTPSASPAEPVQIELPSFETSP